VEDPTNVAETFNKYFVNVDKILAEKISASSSSSTNCQLYLKNRIKMSIFLDSSRIKEVFNIVNSLKCKKMAKNKTIPSFYVKIASHVFAPYLTFFFTLSFNYGIFQTL